MIGHVVPEAATGGPIGLIEDGDVIRIDLVARTLDAELTEAEFATRKAKWVERPCKYSTRSILGRYAKNVRDASHGAVLE